MKKHAGHHTLSELLWTTYPRRVCRSLHHCEICGKDIVCGQEYYDGGYSRRAHVNCIETEAGDAPQEPQG